MKKLIATACAIRMHPVYQGGYNRKGLVDEYGEKKQAYSIMKEYYSRK